MKQISTITIEHVTVISNKPYAQVREALEKKVAFADFLDQLEATTTLMEQFKPAIEKKLGENGFLIFCKIEHGYLLSLVDKPRKVIQYTLGNPLLAVQMTQHVLAVSLYAPFKLAIYEHDTTKTIISYDRFSSLVAQFHHEEITRLAEHVDQLLENLVADVI